MVHHERDAKENPKRKRRRFRPAANAAGGGAWSALGYGLDSTVQSLLLDREGNLYAGGRFTNAGGVAATNIARWNGSEWSALGTGLSGGNNVSALAVSGGILYAGGSFTRAGGIAATNCWPSWIVSEIGFSQ